MIRSKIIFIVLIILLAFSVFQWRISNLKYRKALGQTEMVNTQYREALEQIRLLQMKNDADEMFFAGDFEKALESYRDINDEDTLFLSRHQFKNYIDSLRVQIQLLLERQRQLNQRVNESVLKADLVMVQSKVDSLQGELAAIAPPIDKQFIIDSVKQTLADQLVMPELPCIDTLIIRTAVSTVLYFGHIEDAKAQGSGSGLWSDGGYYTGEWMENKRHGEGLFLWPTGDNYKGDYKNDIRSGNGTYTWSNGDFYTGEWDNNRRNGQGTLYDKSGNIRYSGPWVNDEAL